MSGDQLVRKFILTTDEDVERFMAFMRANRKPMEEQGRFLQVVVSEYKEKRSNDQNSYMWAGILDPIAEQAYVAGQRFKPEVWAEHLKELFLPDVNARGMDKFFYLPNGSRRLAMGTHHLNKAEMSLYLDQIAAYASTELGVLLPVNPSRITT